MDLNSTESIFEWQRHGREVLLDEITAELDMLVRKVSLEGNDSEYFTFLCPTIDSSIIVMAIATIIVMIIASAIAPSSSSPLL